MEWPGTAIWIGPRGFVGPGGVRVEAALAQLRNDVASERAEKEQLLVAHGEAMGEAEAMVRMTFPAQLLGGVGVVAHVGMPVNHPLDRSQRYGGRHGGDGGRGACV